MCPDRMQRNLGLLDGLLLSEAVMLAKELDALLDPARYTGLAGRFVDRVVASP